MQHTFNVYYRTSPTNLHKVKMDKCFDHEDALIAMKDYLHKNMEAYLRPVLTVINGHKK